MMNRILSFLVCAGLMLAAMAGEPQLSRSQLKNAAIIKDNISMPATAAGQEKPLSLQQVLKERHITLNDNKLRQKAPKSLRIDNNQQEQRIASMDLYDFNWDDKNDIAVVIDTSCAMAGKVCYLNSDGDLVLTDFFNSYSIPLTPDEATGMWKLKAGVVLDQQTFYQQYDPSNPNSLRGSHEPHSNIIIKQYLYAMPLSWLAGDDNYDDIPCQLGEDGSIEFLGAFGFLVKTYNTTTEQTTWGLSAIYDNVVLLNPNAIHKYSNSTFNPAIEFDNYDDPTHWGMGGGGIIPRPITPRPQNTKPVKPRQFETVIGRGFDAGYNTGRNEETIPSSERNITVIPQFYITQSKQVYMYMLDDTTLMVYNLYDGDYSWNYMYLQPDGTVDFPEQAVLCKSDTVFNNASKSAGTYKWGNTGTWNTDSITWDNTFFISKDGSNYLNVAYNNKLYFLKDYTTNPLPAPVFLQPVITENEVIISATSIDPEGMVFLYVYDEGNDYFYEVDNPCHFTRLNEPYTVLLGAETYYQTIDEYSDAVFTECEIPAFESSYLRGDANNDGNLNINDVTTLINALLSTDFNDSETFNMDNADCDMDGSIKINDVTTLIGFLLSGQWPIVSN